MPTVIRNHSSPSDANSFHTFMEGSALTLAYFIKLTPSSVWSTKLPTLGWTSYDQDITLSDHSLTFYAAPGMLPTVLQTEQSAVSNFDITGIFDDDRITEIDLVTGKWDNAIIEMFRMNYADLTMGEEVLDKVKITGWQDMQTGFLANLEGINSALQTNYGKLTTSTCRVKRFRNLECKYDEATHDGYTVEQTLAVNEVVDENTIHLTKAENTPADFYINGECIGITGNNSDLAREVASGVISGTDLIVKLKRAFPITVEVGDTFQMVMGCNRTPERCRELDNMLNFRGHPFMPLLEEALQVNQSNG